MVGGGLAERMQHYGWLETLIHARFPQHELVFRNLGYSGDEIDGWRNFNSRLRSMDFGSHDQWLAGSAPIPQPQKLSPRDKDKVRENRFELTNTKADVIFAFYGYNESWAGEAGLAKFKENVDDVHQAHARAEVQRQSRPAAGAVFADRARDIDDRNLPDGRQNWRVEATAHVRPRDVGGRRRAQRAVRRSVSRASQRAVRPNRTEPLTINGIHLNERGDRAGRAAHRSGACSANRPKNAVDPRQLERIRQPSSTRTSTGSTAIA